MLGDLLHQYGRRYASRRPYYPISNNDGIIPVDLTKSWCSVNGRYDIHAVKCSGSLARCGCEVHVDFTPERRHLIAGILAESCGGAFELPLARSHNSPARFRNCRVRRSST